MVDRRTDSNVQEKRLTAYKAALARASRTRPRENADAAPSSERRFARGLVSRCGTLRGSYRRAGPCDSEIVEPMGRCAELSAVKRRGRRQSPASERLRHR